LNGVFEWEESIFNSYSCFVPMKHVRASQAVWVDGKSKSPLGLIKSASF